MTYLGRTSGCIFIRMDTREDFTEELNSEDKWDFARRFGRWGFGGAQEVW